MRKNLFCLLIFLLYVNNSTYPKALFNERNNVQSPIDVKETSEEVLCVDEEECVVNFVEKYDFYSDYTFGPNIILADTIQDATEDSINSIKIILNPKQYYINNEKLYSYNNIVEFSFLTADNTFIKKYYSMNLNEKNKVINKTKMIYEDDIFHQTFISLYNLENDYKATIPQITPRYTIRKSGNVNNQGTLDNYLKAKENLQIQLYDIGNYGNTREFIRSMDDPIVNLIPKETFKNNGLVKRNGFERGYIANTYTDNGNNKITSLIVYDVETQRLNSGGADNVIVKPVISRNFKYNYDLNLVYDDGPNNYCLGNPNYRVNISYTTIENDLNAVVHPNVGDSDYNCSLDNGVCIKVFSQKLVGTGKNSDGKVGLVKFLLKTFNLVSQIATSKIPVLPGLIDKVFTTISDKYEYGETEKLLKDYQLASLPNNKKQYFYKYDSGVPNIQDAKDYNKFFKSFSLKFPEYSNSPDKVTEENFSGNNRQTPLLFKSSSDFLNYDFSILQPSNSDNYTCLIEHSLDFDVFNDNSVRLFRWDPEFICQVKNNWSYLYGGNVKFKEQNIQEGEFINYVCGKNESTEFVFGPVKKSGKFKLVLNDASANTIFSTDQISSVVQKNVYTDLSGNLHDSSYSKPLEHNFSLLEGESFRFKIDRVVSGQKHFGWGSILISEVNPSSYINGTYKKSMNIVRKNLHIDNTSRLTTLSVGKNDFYTISLNSKSNYKDTYIKLFDENYHLIFEDDDGYGSSQAGILVPLFKNKNYYIVSRFYNRSSGEAELFISNEKYAPEISGNIAKESINIDSFGNDKYTCFLISQNINRNIEIEAVRYNNPLSNLPKIKGTMYNCYGNVLGQVDDLNRGKLRVMIETDCLYYLELSTTAEALNGMGLSLFFKNK